MILFFLFNGFETTIWNQTKTSVIYMFLRTIEKVSRQNLLTQRLGNLIGRLLGVQTDKKSSFDKHDLES